MLHQRQIKILELLRNSKQETTAQQLALHLEVSIRTVKSDINDVNAIITSFNCKIESKARKGYWLTYKNQEARDALHTFIYQLDESDTPIYRYERIHYIIQKLLVVDYHIKLEDLAQELSISRSALSGDIKEVKRLLKYYRLKVVSRPNYGIIIDGSEIDKRLCIEEYFLPVHTQNKYHQNSNIYYDLKDDSYIKRITNDLLEILNKYGLVISDTLFNNLLFHLSLSIKRCEFYNYVKVNDVTLTKYQDTVEFRAAQELTRKMEEATNLMLPVGETIYYAMHLQSKRATTQDSMSLDEQTKIHKCINLMLLEIDNNFGLELNKDEELKYYLYLHIPQMVVRLRTHMIIKNPLLKENLRRYFFASKVTHSAFEVIERFYDVESDRNEFGFLMLYFNLAIMKYENKKIIHIGFLSGKGRPESILYFNEIQEVLSSKKYDVFQINSIEEIEYRNCDFLITTYPLDIQLNIPNYIIENENYLNEIKQWVKKYLYHNIQISDYLKEETFVTNLKGVTKDQVLKNFYKELVNRSIINQYPPTHQEFAYDELGNKLVHFQDVHRIVRKNVCFICILEESILWDDDFVQVLILTKTKKEKDIELFSLCSILSKFVSNNNNIKQIIKNRDQHQLLELIKESAMYD